MHPDRDGEVETLVNVLLQNNRWLAHMETSLEPGIVHRFRPTDHGLVLVAKTDDEQAHLTELHQSQRLRFQYRVTVAGEPTLTPTPFVEVVDQRPYPTGTVYDVNSPIGDTETLSQKWLNGQPATFFCYALEVPRSDGRVMSVAMAHRIVLPVIELYTAPT